MGNTNSKKARSSTNVTELKRVLEKQEKIMTTIQETENNEQANTSPVLISSTVGMIRPYRLPTDVSKNNRIFPLENIDRTELQHYALKSLWDGNFVFFAEDVLSKGAMVLDVGCRTGIWVVDMCKDFPRSNFLGIDIKPEYPSHTTKPKNANFRQFDVLNGIPYPDETFEFVHVRFLGATFNKKQYKKMIKEVVRVTRQGGLIELLEPDFKWNNEGPALSRLLDGYRAMLQSKKINPLMGQKLSKLLGATKNVVDIQEETRFLPLGGWGENLGECACEAVKLGFENVKSVLSRSMLISEAEFEEISQTAVKEFDQYQVSMPTTRCWGIKLRRQKRFSSLFK